MLTRLCQMSENKLVLAPVLIGPVGDFATGLIRQNIWHAQPPAAIVFVVIYPRQPQKEPSQ